MKLLNYSYCSTVGNNVNSDEWDLFKKLMQGAGFMVRQKAGTLLWETVNFCKYGVDLEVNRLKIYPASRKRKTSNSLLHKYMRRHLMI